MATGTRTSAQELLSSADIGMYRAECDGKNRCVVFESRMQDTIQNRMELEMDLRQAIENDEFLLVYQPTFDLENNREYVWMPRPLNTQNGQENAKKKRLANGRATQISSKALATS